MAFRLQGKVAIVTGAGQRSEGLSNGEAIARKFAEEGARVLVNDLNQEAANLTVRAINSTGGDATDCVADVGTRAGSSRVLQRCLDVYGQVDVLYNNVGGGAVLSDVVETSDADWGSAIHLNIETCRQMNRAVIPVMKDRGGGAILNMSSISAFSPRGLTAYSAANGALIALTRAMAIDHGPDGIRVNCIAPGPVYTPHSGGHEMSKARRQQRREASCLDIEGTASDVAHCALYLASDEARWVTGVTIPVDGGVSLRSPSR